MGCGKEDSVQPSASNTDTSSIKITKPLNKNSVTGVYQMVSPDGSNVTVQFDINGSFSASIDSEVVEQGLEWQIKDNKLYVFDRKLKQGEWYHAQYDIQENGDLIIKTYWDHGAGYPDGKPLRLEVPKNKQTPFRKIKLAETKAKAEAGDVISQFKLGMMYYNGEGVLDDDKEAVKWYRKSADQGYVPAQACLGYMYENGRGVEQDFKEAFKWYQKAADQGQVVAQNNLGKMYAKGQGVEQDFKEAFKWYRKAAEQGYSDAQYNLGVTYYLGYGVLKNEVTATTWWTIAAVNGNQDAKGNMGAITKEMTPEQIAKAQELSSEMIKKNPKLINK